MVDAELGWHLLLTTAGTESQREIRINPSVDLPDEIHPIYGDDAMGLARATGAIDEAAHYRDDVAVTCPLGLGAGMGDVVSVPADAVAVVGQVESITWTATPDGATDQAVIRRHVAIVPEAFVEPTPVVPPTVADDAGSTEEALTSGNVLANDESGLTIIAVNGLTANVAQPVPGSNGGIFVINSDGSWTFDPNGEFVLSGDETETTAATYHASDGTGEASATLTITVSATPPVELRLVGTATGSGVNVTALTYPVTLPPGLIPGDLVIVASAAVHEYARSTTVYTPDGYNLISQLYANDTRDASFSLMWKIMGETPDTIINVRGAQSNYYGSGTVVQVWRNVDQTNPLDVAPVTATGINASTPNPPVITPVTPGAVVLTAVAATAGSGGTTLTPPAGTENHTALKCTDSGSITIGVASLSWESGEVDLPAWAASASTTSDSWCAFTLALRPAS
jgi:hypothetical protein